MSPFQLHLAQVKAESLYCILIKKPDGLHLVKDPGQLIGQVDKPYAVQQKKLAEETAAIIKRQTGCDTAVHTLIDAFNILMKQNSRDFEKTMTELRKIQ